MSRLKLLKGNNIELLKTLPENSIDAVVTDPPYGLSFMGKKWDYDVPSVEFWKEVFRVLKPGGHILSFGGTRTYHRMVVNIEDAGFEIRDQIMWLYGSGFPKSLNIGKAVDKRGGESIGWFGQWLLKWRKDNNIPQSKIAELFPSKTGGLTGCVSNWEIGNNLPTNDQFNLICKTFNLPFKSLEEAEREFIGTKTSGIGKAFGDGKWNTGEYGESDNVDITKGNSDWEGWGTALKPANEPICLARKPLSEKTVAENVIKWKTGGINIDGCRVGTETITSRPGMKPGNFQGVDSNSTKQEDLEHSYEGRFPANIILECICDNVIKGDIGEIKKSSGSKDNCDLSHEWGYKEIVRTNFTDKGDTHTNPLCPCKVLDYQSKGSSRFFYQAKVSKKERNLGCDELEDKVIEGRDAGQDERSVAFKKRPTPTKNTHPTVKPIDLMAYLCRLITPPNGIVLDPFMGSGSTGIAAQLEGFRFCGMEMDGDYFIIAEKRINNWEKYKK